MGLEPRGRADQGQPEASQPSGEELTGRPKPKVKSFEIDKRSQMPDGTIVAREKGTPLWV